MDENEVSDGILGSARRKVEFWSWAVSKYFVIVACRLSGARDPQGTYVHMVLYW